MIKDKMWLVRDKIRGRGKTYIAIQRVYWGFFKSRNLWKKRSVSDLVSGSHSTEDNLNFTIKEMSDEGE